MFIDRSPQTAPPCWPLLLIAAGIVASWCVPGRADQAAVDRTSQYDRADAQTIKMHTAQILSDPSLAARRTFLQWLVEKLSGWKGPDLDLGSRWTKFIWSLLLLWCILTLLAILAHLVWTVRLLIWPHWGRKNTLADPDAGPAEVTSFEELYRIARELAQQGAFSEAMSVLILGLLRWLDSMDAIRFHKSKTNGDYLREYPSALAGRDEFRKFVLMFEQTIYGNSPGDRQTYWQMSALMERIRDGITNKI